MTGVSTLGQSLAQVRRLELQQSNLGNLASQLATGKKTQKFSGLGNDILTSKRARADFKSLDSYIQNIKNGDRRMKLMLNSIEEIQGQSKTFSGSLIIFSQQDVHQKGEEIIYDDPLTAIKENERVGMTSSEPDVEMASLVQFADSLFDIVSDLLNARDSDQYILNGADVSTQPLGSADALNSAVTQLITDWKDGTITNDQLIADITSGDTTNNPDALTDTTIGFSSALSAGNVGNVSVRAADNLDIDYTVRANEDPFRDLLVGLAFLKNETLLPIADTYTPPNEYPGTPDAQGAPGANLDEMKENFFTVFNSVQAMIENAIGDIDTVRFRVETSRARVDQLKQSHQEVQNFLTGVISEVEDVSLDQVAVEISTLQVHLEASYAVTAQLQQLTLVNFI